MSEEKKYTSLRDLAYNTEDGRAIIGIGVVLFGLGTCLVGAKYAGSKWNNDPDPVKVQQVMGNEKPDICIEKDGMDYCSHVDGKPLNELVNSCYDKEKQ